MKPTQAYFFACFCIFTVAAFAQEAAVVYCDPQGDQKAQIAVYADTRKAWVLEYLACSQPVTFAGIEQGYAKVKIGDRYGYVDSRFIKRLQTSTELEKRVADLEKQIRDMQQAPPPTAAAGPAQQPERPATAGYPPASRPKESIAGPTRWDAAGMFTWTRSFVSGSDLNWFGFNTSIAGNLTKHFGLEGSFGGHYLQTGTNLVGVNLLTFMGGPRFVFPGRRVTPFIHFLAGLGHGNVNVLGIGISGNLLALGPGGGMDVHLNRHFALRAFQADYVVLYTSGLWAYKNMRIGGGIVTRF